MNRNRPTRTLVQWCLLPAACCLLVAIIITAAFQTHPVADIAVGQRVQDDALIRNFNAAEQQPAAIGGRTYRWTRSESALVFPGIGRTAATVTLSLAGGPRPDPQVTILANNGEVAHLRLTPDFADYSFAIPASYLTTGNLTLTLRADPFSAPGDRRELGVLVGHARVQTAARFALPPARPALALWGAVMLLALALAVVGLPLWQAAGIGVTLALGFAALLARDRLFITLGAFPWLRVALLTLALAVVLRLVVTFIVARWEQTPHAALSARRSPWLCAAVLAVFAVRMGGLYHPAMIVSDLIFHVHRFDDVIERHIWYQEIPALYDRNRPVPYPPGAYLLLAPLALIVRNHADLLTVGTQLLDASRALIVGLVVWRITRDDVAAACAAFLAGAVPVAFLIFSWGNLSDAVGEWALTLVFALLALGPEKLRRPWRACAFGAVVFLALMAHIGVAITTVVLLVTFSILWTAQLVWQRHSIRSVLTTQFLVLSPLLVAGLLAVAIFYRIPLTGAHPTSGDLPPTTQEAARPDVTKYVIGGPRPDATIGLTGTRTNNPALALVGQAWEEAWAYYRVWPLLLAPLGIALFRRTEGRGLGIPPGTEAETMSNEHRAMRGKENTGLRPQAFVLVSWLVGTGVLLVVGVLAGRYVRYAVSAMPAVAAGAGVALGYGWRWRWGRIAALALLAVTAVTTLLVWYGRVTRTYHV